MLAKIIPTEAANSGNFAGAAAQPAAVLARVAEHRLLPFQQPLRVLIVVPAVVASLVLMGWLLHIDALRRIAPGLVSMNPLTAVTFLMASAALWLAQRRTPSPKHKQVTQGLAILVLLVGLSKITDLTLGTTLCPDALQFASQLDYGQAFPSRMAPNVALCFILLGLAILGFDRPWFLHPQYLALLITMLALAALVGYAYDTSGFYKFKQYIPMALHSAFNFGLLATAIPLARPQQGYMRWIPPGSAGARSYARLLPACILVPIVLGGLTLAGAEGGWFGGRGTSASIAAVLTAMAMTVLAFLNSLALNRVEMEQQRSDAQLRALVLKLDLSNGALRAEVTERIRLEALARYQATHDVLTGIPNRALFVDRLEQSLGRATRQGQACALFYVDVDDFKPINDRYGHQAGDALLKMLAQRIAMSMRAVDTVARLGGDEFAAIMEGPTSAEHALALAQRVSVAARAPYALTMPNTAGSIEVQVGISVGVALFPGNAKGVDELVSVADRAMYLAKSGGKNRCLLAA